MSTTLKTSYGPDGPEIIEAQGGDPFDPICMGCARKASDIEDYDIHIWQPHDTPEKLASLRREACRREEGTYNPQNGHFLCDRCYIMNGQPTSAEGWICP